MQLPLNVKPRPSFSHYLPLKFNPRVRLYLRIYHGNLPQTPVKGFSLLPFWPPWVTWSLTLDLSANREKNSKKPIGR